MLLSVKIGLIGDREVGVFVMGKRSMQIICKNSSDWIYRNSLERAAFSSIRIAAAEAPITSGMPRHTGTLDHKVDL